jgi:hypothetical protein
LAILSAGPGWELCSHWCIGNEVERSATTALSGPRMAGPVLRI